MTARDFTRVRFQSQRLDFRTFTAADAAPSFEYATARVTRYLSWEPYPSPEAFAQSWQRWDAEAAAGNDAHLVVRTRDGEFIGAAGIHFRDGPEPTVGLWIKEAAWGQGYGVEIVGSLLGWIAGNLGVTAVIYPVVSDNRASRRIAERFGGTVVAQRKRTRPRETGETTVLYRIALPATAAPR